MREQLLALLVFGAVVCGVRAQPATGEWVDLFNGENLDGWVMRGGEAEYFIEDGAIVGQTLYDKPNTFLCTSRDYADFILEYEFKVDPAMNSGVQIRSRSLPDYHNGRVHGYQVEIDPAERAWTAGIYDEGRRGWLNDLSHNEPARKAFRQNEWNKIRVEAIGDSIKTWLNGVPAADLRDDMTLSGFIALQVHNTKSKEPLQVRWRNLRIKEIKDGGQTMSGDEKELSKTRGTSVYQSDSVIGIKARGQELLVYHKAPVTPPEGASELYTRSSIIHPLRSLSGEVLTVIHPKDHIHHLGIWNPWTSTEFEGRHVDFWNLALGQGTVRFKSVESIGPDSFEVVKEHVDLSAPGGEKVALIENLKVNLWLPQSLQDPKGYFVDYVFTQRCASESPLHLNQYRYGGLGFRMREDWNAGNSNYLTSEGKTRVDGHETRARWCDLWGQTPKGIEGVLVMSHPQNHAHPEPMRIWPDGPIFFNFCPIQAEAWTLEPGNDYVFRYRLYVHGGELTAEDANRLWNEYAQQAN